MPGVRNETERDEVERPFLDQLVAMGWTHVRGPDLGDDERSAGDAFLTRRLHEAMRRVNRLPESDAEWLERAQADTALADLRQAAKRLPGQSALDANGAATELLLHGTQLKGHPTHHRGNDVHVHYLDWRLEDPEHLARNEFLVVDQFRVRTTDGRHQTLDLVLFVNGIPLVVVECKSPDVSDPTGAAVYDLRAYAGDPLEDDARSGRDLPGAVPGMFATAQLLVAASGETAALGTLTSEPEHYAPWRSVTPQYADERELRRELEGARTREGHRLLEPGASPTEQQKLIAMVLHPRNLLNVVRHYVFELSLETLEDEPPKRVKTVCRHQQYRAVEKIVHKLRTGPDRTDPGVEEDGRGGVVWHTQGSGKSLTMAFLTRRLHMSHDTRLNGFTVLVVTDRTTLQDQLAGALRPSGSTVQVATSQTDLEGRLERAGGDAGRTVIFAMIQKYLGSVPGLNGPRASDDRSLSEDFARDRARVAEGENAAEVADPSVDEATTRKARRTFRTCSESPRVLVLVDEAHRSHTSVLHACLRQALPNAARVGFTGTPIMKGQHTDTARIFGIEPDGRFLDTYRLHEAEADDVVVPIRYEGRTGPAQVVDEDKLDRGFEDLVASMGDAEAGRRVRDRWAPPSNRDVAESDSMIRAKAADILEHYVLGALGGGFKAQLAAVSRRAAVSYRTALRAARDELMARVRSFDPATLRTKPVERYTRDELLLLRAWHWREVLGRMDFVPVISPGSEYKSGLWREWSDAGAQRDHIERFLKPFPHLPPDSPWEDPYVGQPVPAPEPVAQRIGHSPWSGEEVPPEAGSAEEKPPIAFLIVKSMLLTGFDAPIEQTLYLDRPIQDAELLQAMARVNRPARKKKDGRVVDYYGVLNDVAVTLAAYRGEPAATTELTSVGAELPALEEAADAVAGFLSGAGVERLDSRADLTEGMLTLDSSALRAQFDELLREFLNTLERVLPHEKALRHVPHAKQWTLLQKRVRRHYRDASGGAFSLRGVGRQVRALIADHLDLPEISEAIPPVSILAADFDDVVGRIPDVRESAAEQVQALRYHLQERLRQEEQPVYRALSEELEEVLREFDGRWEEIQIRVGPLLDQTREAERADAAVRELSPGERRLHAALKQHLTNHPAFDTPDGDVLRRVTDVVYGVVTHLVTKQSYTGRDGNVDTLSADIQSAVRDAKLLTGPTGQGPLHALSNELAGIAQDNLEVYRSEGRAQ